MGFQLKNTIAWINKTGDFSNLLRSRIVLYLFFAISIINLYSFAINNDIVYGSVFLIVGYLTTFFSKNMIVILCCALAVSNILKYGTEIRVKEGFEEGQTSKNESEPASGSKSTSSKTEKPKEEAKKEVEPKKEETPKGVANMALGLPQSSKDDINTIMDAQNKLAEGVKMLQPILDKATAAMERLRK